MTLREFLISISGTPSGSTAFRDVLKVIRDKPPISTESIYLANNEDTLVSQQKYGIIAKIDNKISIVAPQVQQDQVIIEQDNSVVVYTQDTITKGVVDGLQKSC